MYMEYKPSTLPVDKQAVVNATAAAENESLDAKVASAWPRTTWKRNQLTWMTKRHILHTFCKCIISLQSKKPSVVTPIRQKSAAPDCYDQLTRDMRLFLTESRDSLFARGLSRGTKGDKRSVLLFSWSHLEQIHRHDTMLPHQLNEI